LLDICELRFCDLPLNVDASVAVLNRRIYFFPDGMISLGNERSAISASRGVVLKERMNPRTMLYFLNFFSFNYITL
jgi:hypothetical protein